MYQALGDERVQLTSQVRRDRLPGQEQDRLVRQDHRQQRGAEVRGRQPSGIEAWFTGFRWDVDIIDLRYPPRCFFSTTSRSFFI